MPYIPPQYVDTRTGEPRKQTLTGKEDFRPKNVKQLESELRAFARITNETFSEINESIALLHKAIKLLTQIHTKET